MALTEAITTVLYYVVYPVVFVTKLLLAIVFFLLTPLLHLGRIVSCTILVPFRILAKFESLYYFLGVAIVIGIITGLFLHVIDRSLSQILQIPSPDSQKDLRQKDPKLHEPARVIRLPTRSQPLRDNFTATAFPRLEEKAFSITGGPRSHEGDKALSDFYVEWVGGKDTSMLKDSGLFSTTILEEEDDNHDSDEF